jgi:type I restriction enzyme S subunit
MWNMCRVSELIERKVLTIGDGYRAKNSELGAAGIPFVRAGDIGEGIQLDRADRLLKERLSNARGKTSRPHDVVFTSKGTVGRIAMVPPGLQEFVYSPQLCFWRVVDADVLDPRFLYYWLVSEEGQGQLAAYKDQTDMAPYISLRDQRLISVPIPPPPLQRKIATILAALDDKIALNRDVNNTIQSLLQAAFQQAETAGTDIGIEMLARVVGGSTPSTANSSYWGGQCAWATPKDLAGLRDPVLLDTGRHITEAGLAQISSGLLPTGTVLISSRAPIGYLAITEIPVAVNQGFIALVPNGTVSSHFLLGWAWSHMADIKARANGTTFQEISKANFRSMTVSIPDEHQLKWFDEIAGPLHSLLVANARESLSLAQLRDALLPELISGRMTVN